MKEKTSVVVEEYLQAIYSLYTQGDTIKAVTLTKWLKSSPSTVHATLSRMQRDKLVKVNSKKQISLTKLGKERAESLERTELTETMNLQSSNGNTTLTFDIAGKIGAVKSDVKID